MLSENWTVVQQLEIVDSCDGDEARDWACMSDE